MAQSPHEPGCVGCSDHTPSIWSEFVCHVPYTVISLVIGFVFAGVLHVLQTAFAGVTTATQQAADGYNTLFHVFHFLHIIFAVTGTTVTFFRYSRRVALGVIVSIAVPAIFCMLSDSVLPMAAGVMLGVDMQLHICWMHLHDAINMGIFLLTGLAVGAALLQHAASLRVFSYGSHFFHIFCSALASLFYIVSHGYTNWPHDMGLVFISLFVAVIVPCTLSDVVVPLYCVGASHSHKE